MIVLFHLFLHFGFSYVSDSAHPDELNLEELDEVNLLKQTSNFSTPTETTNWTLVMKATGSQQEESI